MRNWTWFNDGLGISLDHCGKRKAPKRQFTMNHLNLKTTVLRAPTGLTATPPAIGTALTQLWTLASCVLAALMLTGCASTKVTSSDRLVYDQLPRPDHILVYDFADSAADVPADSAYAGKDSAPAAPPTDEQIQIGRELGTQIAAQLVEAIQKMGLPAIQASPATQVQVNDIVIRGYLISIEQGSAAKRITLGFGAGGSEMATAVEGYQMTATGLRKLGSGTTASTGNKTPGAAVGAASWLITGSPVGLIVSGGMKVYGEASGSSKVEGRAKATAKEIAERLEMRFKEQGWIQ
jgi:hypothetical protein